jgi:hypothetical protein
LDIQEDLVVSHQLVEHLAQGRRRLHLSQGTLDHPRGHPQGFPIAPATTQADKRHPMPLPQCRRHPEFGQHGGLPGASQPHQTGHARISSSFFFAEHLNALHQLHQEKVEGPGDPAWSQGQHAAGHTVEHLTDQALAHFLFEQATAERLEHVGFCRAP